MDGAHRARLARRHGVEHGDDLVAQHLAHDHPVGVVAVGAEHQIVHGHRSLAFGVGLAGLPGHAVGVAVGQFVQTELVGELDGDDAVRRVRLGGQRAEQRGLAGVGAARDDHVEAGPHRGAQEPGQLVAQRVGQVVEGGVDEAVTTDRHARAVRHLDHGREPVPTGEVEVDDGLGGIDPALSAGVVRPGGPLDQLDQVRVAVRDRLDPFLGAIRAFHPHVIGPVDVDVLDVVLVEEQLEAAESQLRGDQAADDLVLLFGTRRGDAPLDHGTGGLVDRFAGELLDEGAAIAFAHARRSVADDPVGDVLGGVGLELSAFGVVHVSCPPVRSGSDGRRRVGGPLRRAAPRPTAPVSPQRGALRAGRRAHGARGRRGQLRRRPRPGPAPRRPLLRCPLLRCALLRCRLPRCPVKRSAWRPT